MSQFCFKLLIKQLILIQYTKRIQLKTSPLKDLRNSVQLFNLTCNEETGVFTVHECIRVDRNLHVRLSCYLVKPLPHCFDINNCILTKFSMLENFVSCLLPLLVNFLNLASVLSTPNANLNMWPDKVMIIYSNYLVEVHQVLHCGILFFKHLALLTLFNQQ